MEIENSMEYCTDYLSVSFPLDRIDEVMTYFNLPVVKSVGYGYRGYRESAYLASGGRIAWTLDRVDAHINLPSQALHTYFKTNNEILGFLRYVLSIGGNVSRIDQALDDKVGIVGMDEIARDVKDKNWVCRSTRRQFYEDEGDKNGESVSCGKTITIGSPKSDTRLRIYDKRKEQGVDGHWIRYELTLRDKAAMAATSLLLNTTDDNIGKSVIGMFRGYCDFRIRNSNEKTYRRELVWWWKKIVSGCERVKLARLKMESTIDKAEVTLDNLAPTLAVIRERYRDGFNAYINRLADRGKERWTSKHYRMLADR